LWAIAAFSVEARLLGALARQSNIWVEAFAAGGARSKGADTGFKPVQAGFGRYDAISSGWGAEHAAPRFHSVVMNVIIDRKIVGHRCFFR